MNVTTKIAMSLHWAPAGPAIVAHGVAGYDGASVGGGAASG